jgi:hypothetical protein
MLTKIEEERRGVGALPFWARSKYLTPYEREEIEAEVEGVYAETAELIKLVSRAEDFPPRAVVSVAGRYCASPRYGSGLTLCEILRECRNYPERELPDGRVLISYFRGILAEMAKTDRGLEDNGRTE